MSAFSSTFATTTTLSVLLHGVVVVGWLAVAEPFTATGQGLQVQLVSSYNRTSEAATETQQRVESQPVQPLITKHVISEHEVKDVQKNSVEKLKQSILSKQDQSEQNVLSSPDIIAVTTSSILVASSGKPMSIVNEGKTLHSESLSKKSKKDVSRKMVKPAQPVLSTNALQQQHSILELLHNSISNNKEYPYIARRQRREGVAKIGFVLNPDGSIHNARLVTSSHANVLDRAALSAVRAIEPFKPAQHYLEQAEAFEIDVVFQLL